MRRFRLPLIILAAALSLRCISASEFQVHEWGTFTTLHTTNGVSIEWYQPYLKRAEDALPKFVAPGIGTKFGNMRIRMETPVIYFYTKEPRKVTVNAAMAEGNITEVFPRANRLNHEGTFSSPLLLQQPRFSQSWDVDLIPPGSRDAADIILPTDTEDADNHYYIARQVPEAAFVKAAEAKMKETQYEKFIFYRGAGNESLGSPARIGKDGTVSLNQNTPYNTVWLLDSKPHSLAWQKLTKPESGEASTNHEVLPNYENREKSIQELFTSLHSSLVEAGLSDNESKAMINTWRNHWFTEPGVRILSLPPRNVIDQLVPLRITPSPSSLERVFVHRAEILLPEVIENLEKAMSARIEPEEARDVIESQNLGRFTRPAIIETARQIGNRTAAEHQQRGLSALKTE
ncbi:MAG: hypothetical protein P1V20_28720 [Verrucomicrobiales bacterium]|nr:hypothetical protein [Verrucomicrobiales bacterium]